MKKSDLKDGMVVEFRNGTRCILVLNNYLLNSRDYIKLSSYLNDLRFNNETLKNFDIVKIYKPKEICSLNNIFKNKNLEFVWARSEKLKLTEDERTILKSVDKKYKYIARDKDNRLFVFEDKPTRFASFNWGSNEYAEMKAFKHLFQMLQWDDEEPTIIEDLLRNE